MRSKLACIACFLWATIAGAAAIDQPLADAAQEKTAQALFHELRCVICDGQSIAESNATLAAQMRDHVRGLVAKGNTNADILSSFHASYGDSILMTPPVKDSTVLLWFIFNNLCQIIPNFLNSINQPLKTNHT